MRCLSALALAAALIACSSADPTTTQAADDTNAWPQWRGPDGTGAAPDADPVTAFNLDTGENVKWTADLPGPSAGTPAVVGDRVFVAAGTTDTQRMLAMGLDRKTGKILWKDDVGPTRKSRQRGRENNHAECSAAADDKHVYFIFGSGDLIAYTHDGEKAWHINIAEKYGSIEILWGYGSSPLLMDGKLYIMSLRRKPSFLLCVDPANGEILWKQDRPTDAQGESPESYASPIAATIDGKQQVVVYGGDCLTGHDPQTGEELWRFTDGINPQNNKMFRVIAGPTQGLDGVIYFTTPRGEDLFAVQVENNTPKLKYYVKDVRADVPCPVYANGDLFVLSGAKKTIYKFDAETGEEIWKKRLDTPGYFRCTPTVAGDHVYLITGDGELFVLSAGDEFKQAFHADLGGYPTRATIAVAGDDLFIRTGDRLICAGR